MTSATLTVKVNRIVEEAEDIRSYELIDPSGAQLPDFTPGAHVDVHIAEGLVRQYSLCSSDAETDRYVIAVQREVQGRGGSRALHERVREGDILRIGMPRNHFRLSAEADFYLLLAGGIGVTPILAMARYLAAAALPFEMHYCTRGPARTAFRDELSKPEFVDRVTFHFDNGPMEQRLDLDELLSVRPPGGHLYLCGPTGFMAAVEKAASHQWPPDAIHVEYFAADPQVQSGDKRGFQVELAKTGGVFTIPPDKSVVEALAEHGIEIQVSCEQGVCGTCLTALLEGQADHRDVFLTDHEKQANNQFMPCVSRAKTRRLVLDL